MQSAGRCSLNGTMAAGQFAEQQWCNGRVQTRGRGRRRAQSGSELPSMDVERRRGGGPKGKRLVHRPGPRLHSHHSTAPLGGVIPARTSSHDTSTRMPIPADSLQLQPRPEPADDALAAPAESTQSASSPQGRAYELSIAHRSPASTSTYRRPGHQHPLVALSWLCICQRMGRQ